MNKRKISCLRDGQGGQDTQKKLGGQQDKQRSTAPFGPENINKNHIPLTVATQQPWWDPTEQELRDEVRRWEDLGMRAPSNVQGEAGAESGLKTKGKGAEEQMTQNYPWLLLGTKAGG